MKKHNISYRLTAALASILLCGIELTIPIKAEETTIIEGETLFSFEELREMFPAGRYWNHMGMDTNNALGTTDTPCNHNQNGTKYCNKANRYDSQCYGYAEELSMLIYGSYFKYWEHDHNTNNLKAGDVILINYVGQFNGHTVMVTDVKDDIVYYTDCNSGNTCVIKWDSVSYKESFAAQFTDVKSPYINGVYHAPFEAPKTAVSTGHIMTVEEAAGQTLPDGSYRIVSSLRRNFFLNHAESTAQDDANVSMKLYHYALVPGQSSIWELAYQSNGFYTIQEKESGLYLSVGDSSTASKTNVVLRQQEDSDTQLWSIAATDSGYEIRSKCGAWYLNVESLKIEDNRNVQVWINDGTAQSWGFIPEQAPESQPVPEDMYYIRSVSDPDYYLHITGLDASQVLLYNCTAELSKVQKDAFSVAHFSSGGTSYGFGFPYKDAFLFMDLDTDTTWEEHLGEGCNLNVYHGASDATKQSLYWDICPTGTGTYYIVSKASGYCLSSDVEVNGDEANLSQRHYTGADNQQWILEPVNPHNDEEKTEPQAFMQIAPNQSTSAVDINIYVSIPEGANAKDYAITFGSTTKPASACEATILENGGKKRTYYLLKVSSPAKNMRTMYSYSVTHGDIVDISGETSIRQYANQVLAGEYSDSLKKSCRSMLAYGTAAQVYKDFETAGLNEDQIEGDGWDYSHITLPSGFVFDKSGLNEALTASNAPVEYYGMSLEMSADTRINLAFRIKTGTQDQAITYVNKHFALNGKAVSAMKNGTSYVVIKSDGIRIADLLKDLQLQFDKDYTINVKQYMSSAASIDDVKLQNVCKALLNYYNCVTGAEPNHYV